MRSLCLETPVSAAASKPSLVNTTRHSKGLLIKCICGILSIIVGIATLVWTPYSILMNERLRMRKGLPPYEWWADPPDEVHMLVYAFNVTNAEEFLSGEHSKIQFEEVGPFIFLEKLRHTNVTHNDNNTMSYTAHRTPIYLPHLNEGRSLNDTIVLPNMALLGMASYLSNSPFFVKMGFNLLASRMKSQAFITTTIQEYFWNLHDPLLSTSRRFAPTLIPVENMGILAMVYRDFVDDVTVYVGPGNDRRFFEMDTWRGRDRFGYWRNRSCDLVAGGTEGVSYRQHITPQDVMLYWRKTVCRLMPIYYTHQLQRFGMTAFNFELPDDVFSTQRDCYSAGNTLPGGLSDLSPCYFDFPMAASLPHFLHAEPIVQESVEGLRPNRSMHRSYIVVEPETGIPMESIARIQCNLVMGDMRGFGSQVNKFSKMYLPMFWIEYKQATLPSYISNMMYFTVVVVRNYQGWMSAGLIVFGMLLLLLAVRRFSNISSVRYSSLEQIPSTASS